MQMRLTPTTAAALGVTLIVWAIAIFGGSSLAFTTFAEDSTTATATVNDTFTFIEGANVTLELDSGDKSLTITAATTGSSAFELDLGNDASAESAVLSAIQTTGDTNGCFSEAPADQLLIDLSCNWPTADSATTATSATTAGALSSNPAACSSSQFVTDTDADGTLTCAQPGFSDLSGSAVDSQVPDTITIDLAATATALAADPADCGSNTKADSIAASGALTCSAVDTGDITDDTILEADLDATDTASDEECLTYESGAGGDFEWQSCATGTSVALDLADDDSNESAGITEIATENDTNSVFTEPTADKLYINLAQNWPSADTADALAANPDDCSAGEYAVSIVASGNLSCDQVAFTQLSGAAVDSQVPDTITIDLAATATAFASNPSDCSSNQFAQSIDTGGNLTCAALIDADVPDTITIDLAATATALAANGANCSAGSAPLGVDAAGAAESCTDYVDVGGDTMTGNLTVSGATVSITGSGSRLILNLDCSGNSNDGTLSVTGDGVVTCFDDDSGAGATGTVNTIEEDNAQVGGADIVTIDFGTGLDVSESPDTEVNVSVDVSELTINFSDLSGSAVDSQIPDTITIDLAATATALAGNAANCSAGSGAGGVDASGAAEDCTDYEEDLSNSAGLAGALDDETGTNLAVFNTSPTLTGTVSITGAGAQLILNLDCSGNSNEGTLSVTSSGVVGCFDDDSGAGATGTVNTLEEDNSQVGGSDIVTIDFGTGFDLSESPDTEMNISIDVSELTINFTDLTGSATDGQIPDNITIDLAATAAALAANAGNCGAGSGAGGIDASGAAEDCTDYEEDLTDSSGLAGALDDETGTNLAVFSTSPTLSGTVSITGAGAQLILNLDCSENDNEGTLSVTGNGIVGCFDDDTGGSVNSFSTIDASSGTDPVATSSTDTLTVTGGTGITVTGDSGADSLTIATTVVDTGPDPDCAGTTTYQDGEGGCDTLDGLEDFETPTDAGMVIGNGSTFDTRVIPECNAGNQALAFTGSGTIIGCKSFVDTHRVTIGQDGDVSTTMNVENRRIAMSTAGIVTDVYCLVTTAPTSSAVTFDVNLNGTTIFTTQSNRPSITAGNNLDHADAVEVADYVAEDLISVEIDAEDSGDTAADFNCTLVLLETLASS